MEFKDFFEKINQLSSGEKAALKRNCGVMLEKADGNAIIAFYKCMPYDVAKINEPYWFASACFACLFKEQGTQRLEQCFAVMKNDSQSLENRIAQLLDMNWDTYGYFLQKLTRLVKMVNQKGYKIDCESLLKDLLGWNNDAKYVQKRWARALYIREEKNEKENGGE